MGISDQLAWDLVNRVLLRYSGELTEKAPEPIEEKGFALHVNIALDRLLRKLTLPKGIRVINCIFDAFDNQMKRIGDRSFRYEICDLSDASQTAIHTIDRFATEFSYRMFADRSKMLDGHPPLVTPPAKKVSAFLAYRRTHSETALHLHNIMSRYGNGTLFDPYIDHHDMRLGDWANQLLEKIDTVDVFVALVSPDYAEYGTFGLVEYERAVETAAKNGWSDFFAPILLGTPESDPGLELRSYHAFIARDNDEISEDNKGLQHWLSGVAYAGMARLASG